MTALLTAFLLYHFDAGFGWWATYVCVLPLYLMVRASEAK